jgi:hypothetical protein
MFGTFASFAPKHRHVFYVLKVCYKPLIISKHHAAATSAASIDGDFED